jgi:AbrB family looped-hinge helix DNA binding protein
MGNVKVKVSKGGRVVIPVEYRRALGIRVGDEVIVSMEDGVVHVATGEQVLRRSQDLIRQYVPAERSLVDELIADRRAEAARE